MNYIVIGRSREDVKREWRIPHELNDLFSSPGIIRVFKLRRVRWAGRVAYMGERRGV
jgi:hypothetical protein